MLVSHLVVGPDKFDNVWRVIGELSYDGALKQLTELPVQRQALLGHSKDDVHLLLSDLVRQLADGRIILQHTHSAALHFCLHGDRPVFYVQVRYLGLQVSAMF